MLSRGPRTVIIAMIMAIALSAVQMAPVGGETLTEDLDVFFEPTSMELRPDESAVVELTLRNLGNVTYYVLVKVSHVDAGGRSHSRVDPDYLQVGPDSFETVDITVTSRASWPQDPDISDMKIRFYWSRVDDPRMDINDTKEGTRSFVYDVVDVFDVTDLMCYILPVMAFSIANSHALVYRVLRDRREKGTD